MWTNIARAVTIIITAILEFIQRKRAQERVRDVQKEHDTIEENPSEWFEGHFGASSDSVRPDDNVATIERSDMSAGGDGVSD